MKKALVSLLLFAASLASAQQPQAQSGQPIYPVNAKYTQGVGPGYWPTAGGGLTLNLAAGTANCAGTIATYTAGTLTMTASTTNYVYLNTSSSCAPAVKTTAFVAADIPIAKVVTGSSSITSITDDRTMFLSIPSAMTYPSAGLAKSTGTAWTTPSYSDVVALFGSGSCAGYLKNDGTCSTSGGMVYPSAGMAKSTGTAWATPTYADFVNYWASGSCSGYLKNDGTCSISSGTGLASLNGLTGPALSLTNDDTMSITPSGTSIALHSNGIQYNPTTTAYIVGSFSGLYDDSDAHSTALPTISGITCVPGTTSTCTVGFASAHGLSVGGAIDMHAVTGWPYSQQAAQYGSFQITTVPTTTQVTFTTPTSLSVTCASSCGIAYDASYWAIWDFAREPYIYAHGTVYGIENTSANIAANFTSYTSGITGSPIFYIDQSGQNDFYSGASAATVEGNHQTIWAAAHSAGMIVLQSTMVPAMYGIAGVDIRPAQINLWYWQQTKTASNVTTGQYFDRYVDTATALNMGQGLSAMPDQQPNVYFADALNAAFSSQKTIEINPPATFTFSVTPLGGTGVPGNYTGARQLFYDANWNRWMDWDQISGSPSLTYYATANTPIFISLYATQGTGATWCPYLFGVDGTSHDYSVQCFHFAGSGSTSNYMSFMTELGGSEAVRFYEDGSVVFPSIATSPSTSPVCPNGTNGALTTSGCASGSGIADISITVTGATQGANSCSSASSGVTMTGLTTSLVVIPGYSSDPSSLTGWGSSAGMVFQAWPDSSNTLKWRVCNQTASSITFSSITFNVGAK